MSPTARAGHNRPMSGAPSAPVLPSPHPRALVVATLAVILLTWIAVVFAGWRGREDAIDDWRFFLANLSEMAAQHADQTLAAADTVLERLVDDISHAAPADEADLVAKTGTREMFELLKRRQGDLPQIDVLSIVGTDGRLINFSRASPTPPA